MIHAFADDSVTDELVTCGVAIFHQSKVEEAEALLVALKQRFGIPAKELVHCRRMFFGDARRGTAWQALTPEQIYDLVRGLCTALRGISERPLVVLIDPHAAPPQPMTPDGPVRRLDVKEVASLAHSAAITGLATRYDHDGFRLWTDPDRTKIPWGEHHRRADGTRRPYLDLGPGIEPPQLIPNVEESPKPALLQIADIYAYAAAQAHSQRGGQRVERFRQLYAMIDPERAIFQWNQDTKWEDA